MIGGAHELEEGAGRAAIFAISLRHDDRGEQADHGQGQGNRDPDPEDPGVEGLDLSDIPAGPNQGGQKGPGEGDGRQFAQPSMPTGGDGHLEALKASQELLGRPMRADLMAIGLAARPPRDEEGDASEDQQGGGLGPRDAMAGPAGEEGKRKQLAEPEAEAPDEEDLPDGADDGSAVQGSEGHQERTDKEAPKRRGAEALLGVLLRALAAVRVIGEARL